MQAEAVERSAAEWETWLTFRWEALRARLPVVPAQGKLARLEHTDFQVEEVPAYLPGGEGEHLYVRIRKRGISTQEVARRLAQAGGVDAMEVGFAGRKDVHAVATQWFSLPRKAWKAAELDGGGAWEVLESKPHRNKLQAGHLRGNTFRILLREPVPGAMDVLRARMEAVARGVPNYFGPQRFGMDGRNAVEGWHLLTGKARPRDRRITSLLVSAAQSHVFNHCLSARLAEDPALHPREGDLLEKRLNGAKFPCTDPAADAPRVDALEVSVTGPLPGVRMRAPGDGVLTWESRILEDVWPAPTCFQKGSHTPTGDRRAYVLVPEGLAVDAEADGIRVSMTLSSGAFATSVLREWAGITDSPDPE